SQRPLEKHEGKFIKWISKLLGIKLNGRTKEELLTPKERRRKTIEKLLENLTVEIVRDTNVIKVRYKQAGPKYDAPIRATNIANTVALIFEESMKEDMKRAMLQAENFADAQLRIVEEKLKDAEWKLQNFESENRTISLDDEARAILEVLAGLDSEIYQAEASKTEAEARLQGFIQELSRRNATILSAETLSKNPVLLSLREELAKKEIQLGSLKKRFTTTDNLKIKLLEGEIDDLKNRIADETESVLGSTTKSPNPIYQKLEQDIIIAQSDVIGYEARIAVLEHQKRSFDDEIARWPEKKIQLLQLQQDLAMHQKIRDSLLATKQEAGMAQEAELGNVRIWDRAIEPQKPVGPRKRLNILLGALIGLTLGIGLAFLRHYFDNTYPSLEDVHKEIEALPVPVSFLGVIPTIEETEEQGIGLMTHDAPKRGTAEAFRIVRTKLQFMDAEKPPRVLLVTSSTQGEGKTTIASNLAITFAQMEKKVILVDADLRRPSLHKIYSKVLVKPSNDTISSAESEVARDTNSETYVDTVQTSASPPGVQSTNLPDVSDDISLTITDDIRKPGLSELLLMMNEKEPIEALQEVIKETEVENLHLLTSGTIPPNPSELLSSERMKDFVRLLEQEYDYVILDSPPVRAVADPVILSTLVDCVIYIADIVKTKRPDIKLGLETLSDASPRNIGMVCNVIDPQYGGYYGYGRYGYSKYGYYGRYRYSSYYYYYYYYASDEEEEENQEPKRNKKRGFLLGRNK
ncbi:TPA: hypothetical protein EYP66_16410, partial [Candidatus Poribacteria bacterium]|nr:hypothetical protein [Candidatus Poribacteria bacterium]